MSDTYYFKNLLTIHRLTYRTSNKPHGLLYIASFPIYSHPWPSLETSSNWPSSWLPSQAASLMAGIPRLVFLKLTDTV